MTSTKSHVVICKIYFVVSVALISVPFSLSTSPLAVQWFPHRSFLPLWYDYLFWLSILLRLYWRRRTKTTYTCPTPERLFCPPTWLSLSLSHWLTAIKPTINMSSFKSSDSRVSLHSQRSIRIQLFFIQVPSKFLLDHTPLKSYPFLTSNYLRIFVSYTITSQLHKLLRIRSKIPVCRRTGSRVFFIHSMTINGCRWDRCSLRAPK